MLSEAMDIPAFAVPAAGIAGLPGQIGNGKAAPSDIMDTQIQSSRPVWAGPSWPIANSVGGARGMISGTSPYGKSIDMSEAIQNFADGGET